MAASESAEGTGDGSGPEVSSITGWDGTEPKWYAQFAAGLLATAQTGELSAENASTDFSVVILLGSCMPGVLIQRGGSGPDDPFRFRIVFNSEPHVDSLHFWVPDKDGEKWLTVHPRDSGIFILGGQRNNISLVREDSDYRIAIDGITLSPSSNSPPDPTLHLEPLSPGEVALGNGRYFGAGLWSRALHDSELLRVGFGYLNGHQLEMQCYWSFDGSFVDATGSHRLSYPIDFPRYGKPPTPSEEDMQRFADNQEIQIFYAGFYPTSRIVGLVGSDGYQFRQIESAGHPLLPPEDTYYTSTLMRFPAEIGGFCVTLTGRGEQIEPPAGVRVRVRAGSRRGPWSQYYDHDSNTDSLLVHRVNDSVVTLVMSGTMAPDWAWIEISCRANAAFVVQAHVLPTSGGFRSMNGILAPFFSGPDREAGVGRRSRAGADLSLFERVAATALTAVAAVAAVALGGVPVLAAVAFVGLFSVANAEEFLNGKASHSRTVDVLFGAHGHRKGVLAIDAGTKTDQGADIVYQKRQRYLYNDILSDLDQRAFRLHKLVERDDTRAMVREHLARPEVVYVTATGHGAIDALFGHGIDKIVIQSYGSPKIDRAKVEGKIFHILACNCGRTLCAELVRLGALAAIGYNEPYGVATVGPSPLAAMTVRAACKVDEILLAGGTARQAVDAATAEYQAGVARLHEQGERQSIISQLQSNSSYLVLHGDDDARITAYLAGN